MLPFPSLEYKPFNSLHLIMWGFGILNTSAMTIVLRDYNASRGIAKLASVLWRPVGTRRTNSLFVSSTSTPLPVAFELSSVWHRGATASRETVVSHRTSLSGHVRQGRQQKKNMKGDSIYGSAHAIGSRLLHWGELEEAGEPQLAQGVGESGDGTRERFILHEVHSHHRWHHHTPSYVAGSIKTRDFSPTELIRYCAGGWWVSGEPGCD